MITLNVAVSCLIQIENRFWSPPKNTAPQEVCTEETIINDNFSAAIAKRQHPFPSRTRKLSSSAPMVLHGQLCGRVGRRRILYNPESVSDSGFFCAKLFIVIIYGDPGYTRNCPSVFKLFSKATHRTRNHNHTLRGRPSLQRLL
jgi:hypothetical protein